MYSSYNRLLGFLGYLAYCTKYYNKPL